MRLKQKNHQKMSQNPGFGDLGVFAWRGLEADQALQALERHFDAPAGAVKLCDFSCGELLCVERGDKNNPLGRDKRATHDGAAFPFRGGPRFCPRRLRRLFGLAQSDEPEGERRGLFGQNPDGPVENVRRLRRCKSSQEIEGPAAFALPARPFPARAHNDIGALLKNMRQRIGMHVPVIGDNDIPLGEADAIEPLAAFLVCQLDKTEAFRWKIEGAVKTPHPIVVLRLSPGFR